MSNPPPEMARRRSRVVRRDLFSPTNASIKQASSKAARRRTQQSASGVTDYGLDDDGEDSDPATSFIPTRVKPDGPQSQRINIPRDVDGDDLRTKTVFLTCQLQALLQLARIAVEHDRHRNLDPTLATLHLELANDVGKPTHITLDAQDAIVNVMHYKKSLRDHAPSRNASKENKQMFDSTVMQYDRVWTQAIENLAASIPGHSRFRIQWAQCILDRHIGYAYEVDHKMDIPEAVSGFNDADVGEQDAWMQGA